jgi:pilus assembly protein CpaE
MADDKIVVGLEIKTRGVMESLKKVISSIEGCELRATSAKSCDVIVLELGDNPGAEFELVSSLNSGGTSVFLTSASADPEFLIMALRSGAREFFAQPVNEAEVKKAFTRFSRNRREPTGSKGMEKTGKIMTVIGCKGGVGTTTLAVNMASGLAGLPDCKAAVVDLQPLFGEVPIFLDLKCGYNWSELIRNMDRLDATYLMSFFVRHPSGVHVLPSPTSLEDMDAATPEAMERVLDAMRSIFDYIIVDAGNSINDVSLSVLRASQSIFIVSHLNIPSLVNINKITDIFQKLGLQSEKNCKVIINCYDRKSPISIEEAEKSINRKIFWQIPEDGRVVAGLINQGRTLIGAAQKSAARDSLRELVASIGRNGSGGTGKATTAAWSPLVKRLGFMNKF